LDPFVKNKHKKEMGNTLTRLDQEEHHCMVSIGLKNEIIQLQNQLNTKDALISQTELTIQDLQNQLHLKDVVILKRDKSNSDLRNEINVLKNIITHKDNQIDEYSSILTKIRKLENEIQEVLGKRLV